MASLHTPNYHLNQWEATDQVLHTDFNEDNAKVDQVLKTLDQSTKKLTQQAQSQTSQLADHSQKIGQHAQLLQGLSSQMSTRGNCVIVTGSYVGNGKCGVKSPNTLTFSSKPHLLVVAQNNTFFFAYQSVTEVPIVQQWTAPSYIRVKWEGNRVQWYHENSTSYQLNNENTRAYYMALLSASQ